MFILWRKKRLKGSGNKAQVALELSFSLIGTVLIILGTIRLFVWAGRDLIGRLAAHKDHLIEDTSEGYDGTLNQLRPHFYPEGTAPFVTSVQSEVFHGVRPYD
jgi:hypothetical protein